MKKLDNRYKGILFLVVAAFGFAVMSMFVKFVDSDIPTTQKVLFRNAVSVIVSFIMVVRNKDSFYGKKENQKLLIVRSSFGTLGMLLFFYSISILNLGDANMLNKLSTFFLIIFSAIFLNEKVKSYQVYMIIIAFLGSLFIIKPSFDVDIIPYITSILAAMCAGAAYTVLRALGQKEKYYTVVLYFSTFSVVSITLLMLVIDRPFFNFTPMTLEEVVFLTCAGLFATVGQFGTTLAYKYAPAKEIGIFNYTNVVFASIISLLVFDQAPDGYSLIGYLIIFGAAFYMFRKQKKGLA